MSILVKSAYNFGGKIQMWSKSFPKNVPFKNIPPLQGQPQQMVTQMQTSSGGPTTMMMGAGPHMQQGPMRPPPPGMATGSLRLSIPPQQAMPPQPRTPGSTGSQQPSPALTPRSDLGDDVMDSSSSRGTYITMHYAPETFKM